VWWLCLPRPPFLFSGGKCGRRQDAALGGHYANHGWCAHIRSPLIPFTYLFFLLWGLAAPFDPAMEIGIRGERLLALDGRRANYTLMCFFPPPLSRFFPSLSSHLLTTWCC